MSATVLRGPWAPRQALPWPTCRPVDQLPERDQRRLFNALRRDLGGYWREMPPGERWWLLDQLDALGAARLLCFDRLTPEQRARVVDVAMTILRRRAGWAA